MIKQDIVAKLSSINDYNILLDISYMSEFINSKKTRLHVTNRYNIADITIKVILRRLLDQGHITKIRRSRYKINQDVIQYIN